MTLVDVNINSCDQDNLNLSLSRIKHERPYKITIQYAEVGNNPSRVLLMAWLNVNDKNRRGGWSNHN
jgi:hypothetical protein